MDYTPTPREEEVIRIINEEKTEWQDGVCYVTDKVSYKMKDVIQKARKSYLGKFDQERDPVTNKKKINIPLTEDMVETIVKNIDLDSADINVRATNPDGRASANIIRYLVSHFNRKNYFGEIINQAFRLFCIDGTVVLKVIRNYDKKKGGQAVKPRIVDLTNIYISPDAESIQSAPAVIERHIMKLSEIEEYPWENKNHAAGFTDIANLNNFAGVSPQSTTGTVPYIEVFERWGELPKYCITGKEEDKNVWVETMAIVSNIDRAPVVHAVVENKKGIKPYEEAQFRKLFGRWHGRGVGEMLSGLHSYLNEIVNLRLNKARVSQIGLFKYRKGSGITQQMLNALISGGGIPVTRMDDIQELAISDIKASSYQDEQTIYSWSQRATGAWDVGRGESLPASTAATTAVIQERGMRSGMDLLQENLGMFLSRLYQRHIIPLILETTKNEEIISIVGSPRELQEIDEAYTNHVLNEQTLKYMGANGCFPPAEMVLSMREVMQENLDKMKGVRYLQNDILGKLKNWEYEVEVFVTGESFNKAVMVQQLNELLMNYSNIPGVNLDVDGVMKELLDLMGIGGSRFIMKANPAQAMPQNPIPGQQPGQAPQQSEAEMAAQQSTPEGAGSAQAPTM